MAPIVISHGGPDITSQILPGLIAGKKHALDEQRFEVLRKRVEQEMELQDAEEERRKAEFEVQARARQETPGMIGGMFERPAPPNQPGAGMVGPSDPNSEDAQFQASVRANTERMGKIAAKIAETDPERGMEFAHRFLEEEQKNMHRLVADRGITGMVKDIGIGLTTPGTYTVQDPNNPEGDPTYMEAMKGVLQELQAAQGPEVSPEEKVQALQNANKARLAIRREITDRNQKAAGVAAARHTIETRSAEAGGRLTTGQKTRLGGLAANVGFEEGMIPPDKVDEEVERVLRGTVLVDVGGQTVEVTPESAAKLKEMEARLNLIEAQRGSTEALTRQRDALAGLNQKKTGLLLPGQVKGKARGPLDDDRDAAYALRVEFPDGRTADNAAEFDKRRLELVGKGEKAARGPDSPESLKADILGTSGKKLTKPEAEARARALGISPHALKELLEAK